MSHHVPHDPASFVRELFQEIDREVQTGVHGVQDWLDGQIRAAAVGLLQSMLPPLVRGNNAAVRASEWMDLAGASGLVGFTLDTTEVGNTVLSGAVAKKVDEGIGRLRADTDYVRAANSIAW